MSVRVARRFEIKANVFLKILLATVLASVIPLLLVSVNAYSGVQQAKTEATRAATQGLDDQALNGLEMQGTLIAGQISQILNNSVQDLRTAATLPRTSTAYLAFYRAHKASLWLPNGTTSGVIKALPLYREMTYINASGQEQFLIRDDHVLPASQLVNVSNPAHTTYKNETYFAQTRHFLRALSMCHI